MIFYKFESGNWVAQNSVLEGEATNNYFGTSVNLNATGERLVVGAYNTIQGGSIYMYENSDLLSVESFKASNETRIIPNPNNGAFQIKLESIESGTYRVLNSLGQMLYFEKFTNKNTLDVSDLKLQKGFYFVKLEMNGIVEVKRFVVD